ncbi:H-NS histone family protein [Burkholderia multivorans]|uniref:H-NS histone family protein n=1 Tax=Burkholderia multivorans TaxID=87883 RepID=UPI000CFF01BC|nr:H-NS histone family protein [Burkholderia multivorans]AYY98417.1 H-NS histone family protein [Burkholderia multivorans]MBU9120530.1 H-NS histone family protein [Burkholderia multivorans]PRF47866.1 hypothetical protein C6Q04_15420 [Burkholderia multivorans]PRG56260.1 hypothetical protein C6T63_05205 [Burkholderia multivorans]PRG79249.1 hypothetical protein C6T58_17860 [Burkholderia multivorans]
MLNEINSLLNGFAQKRAALEAELTELDQKESESKASLHAEAVAQTQALLDAFNIAPDEVKFKAKRTLKPKYRDPVTGDTWHGYGKRPASLKGIKNLDDYLIDPSQKRKKPAKKSVKQPGEKSGNTKAQAAQSDVAPTLASTTATLNSDASMRGIHPEQVATTPATVHANDHFDSGSIPPVTESDADNDVRLATFFEHSPVFGATVHRSE